MNVFLSFFSWLSVYDVALLSRIEVQRRGEGETARRGEAAAAAPTRGELGKNTAQRYASAEEDEERGGITKQPRRRDCLSRVVNCVALDLVIVGCFTHSRQDHPTWQRVYAATCRGDVALQ